MIVVGNEIKLGLVELINDEIEAYGTESGYYNENPNEIVDKYLNEVTEHEIDEFTQHMECDRDEAIFNYLNEWMFG